MKWDILSKKQVDNLGDLLPILLDNRGIKTKEEKEDFLVPKLPDEFDLDFYKAITLIKKAIKTKTQIIVYGDYDADGICATAIMWEALNSLKAEAMPFIPMREVEGYGISKDGVDSILAKYKPGLIIVVDSGIVAHEAIDYAKKKGFQVIVVDHHEKPKTLPKANVIVHTTKLCAAGIAYFLAKKLLGKNFEIGSLLELAAIATVTDMMTLQGINRSIVRYGLESLNKSKRPGLKAILETAAIEKIGVYEIGFMIGPRLNASGRIDSALTALRLLCTHDPEKAKTWAAALNDVNQERQLMTAQMTESAKALTKHKDEDRIIIVQDESFHQGIIGLIAGKLTDKYYLPSIVISRREGISKASARSITGFNIIEAIRKMDNLLINAGGHPMAAGFTIQTEKIGIFIESISAYAKENIKEEMLERKLRIDAPLPLDILTLELYKHISQLEPYGNGNPEPVFSATGTVDSVRTVGAEGKHLKLTIDGMSAIAFNQGNLFLKIRTGDKISFAYSLALDTYNGGNKLQLKIKDILR